MCPQNHKVMAYICLTTVLILQIMIDFSEAQTYTGHQTIDGTEVYTEIFESQGFARFSNACGSQELTQRELQAGAKPYDIIPCPRPSPQSKSSSPPQLLQPEIDDRVKCSNGVYCEAGSICIKGGGCLIRKSRRVCANGSSYCQEGWECVSGNKCIDPLAEAVAKEYREELAKDRREMQDLNRRMEALIKEIEDGERDRKKKEDETWALAIVASKSGRAYAVAEGWGAGKMKEQAFEDCNIAARNSHHREHCGDGREVSTNDGCVALARSHDMFYGPEESFAAGVAAYGDLEGAKSLAKLYCEQDGGRNCVIVPESITCTHPKFFK